MPIADGVSAHSVVAVKGNGPVEEGNDGVPLDTLPMGEPRQEADADSGADPGAADPDEVLSPAEEVDEG